MVPMPENPRDRIRVMVNLARGKTMTYKLGGKSVTVVPRQEKGKAAVTIKGSRGDKSQVGKK